MEKIEEAFYKAFSEAISQLGVDGLKNTSLFFRNWKKETPR